MPWSFFTEKCLPDLLEKCLLEQILIEFYNFFLNVFKSLDLLKNIS